MTTKVNDEVCESDSYIGKIAIFKHPDGVEGQLYRFCSDINFIGSLMNDVSIRNHTEVMIISEPQVVETVRYGAFQVIKVHRGQSMWIPTFCLQVK